MKRLLTTLVILTGLLGSADAVWAQGFNKGLKAAQSGDFATALKEWKPLADQGDAVAQSNLGLMYGNGNGVLQDTIAAHMWFNIAAANREYEGCEK
jgi:TPR repeat protein